MEPQETRLVSLVVRVPINSQVTRVKAKKEEESQSQETEFEIEADHQNMVPAEVTPGVSQALMECWEWDLETRAPIFHDTNQPWKRYVPDTFTQRANSATERRIFQTFMTGMRGNDQESMVLIGTSNSKDLEKKFNRQIYRYDLKKIQLKRVVGFKMVTITVKKIDDQLLPYSSLPGGEPPLLTVSTRANVALDQINSNVKYGHYGPGTFWCRNAKCTRKNVVTASPVIDYGRAYKFYLTKRFTCAANSCVYMINCNVCKEESTTTRPMYANHCGFTSSQKNMHSRLSQHFEVTHMTNSQCPALPPPVMRELIRLDQDPNGIRQDMCYHLAYEHEIGNEAARLTIFEALPEVDGNIIGKGEAETRAKLAAGSYDYLGHGRGGLNKYGTS